jgi:hypothetical protein
MEMMTLAQRKAAKLSKSANTDPNISEAANQAIHNVTVEEAIQITKDAKGTTEMAQTPAPAFTQAQAQPIAPSSIAAPMGKGRSSELSASDILELARKHGLTLQAPKKEYVKHTYSVTVDSKALFKKYCDTLGVNMQDAMEEAMQDFFKKHAIEYTRVKQAKNS